MKSLRVLLIVIGVVSIAFILERRATAQSAKPSENKGALGQFEQLILSLNQRGDTNTFTQLVNLVATINTERDAADIAPTVRILEGLRSGDTNAAIRLLETRLDGKLMTFGAPSNAPHDAKYDKILKMAKEYRSKHPHSTGNPTIDKAVSQALETSAQ